MCFLIFVGPSNLAPLFFHLFQQSCCMDFLPRPVPGRHTEARRALLRGVGGTMGCLGNWKGDGENPTGKEKISEVLAYETLR